MYTCSCNAGGKSLVYHQEHRYRSIWACISRYMIAAHA